MAFYVVTVTNLMPTNESTVYGAETLEVQEHAEDMSDKSINCNNQSYDFSVAYDTEEEAQDALDLLAADYPTMSPYRTQEWLFEKVQGEVMAEMDDGQLEAVVLKWASDKDDIENAEALICKETAFRMCTERRDELVAED
jgi:hypothetical protein